MNEIILKAKIIFRLTGQECVCVEGKMKEKTNCNQTLGKETKFSFPQI
jgi:hypothetical protein